MTGIRSLPPPSPPHPAPRHHHQEHVPIMSNYIFMVMVMMIKLVREENERGGRNENSQDVTVWCPRVPESQNLDHFSQTASPIFLIITSWIIQTFCSKLL